MGIDNLQFVCYDMYIKEFWGTEAAKARSSQSLFVQIMRNDEVPKFGMPAQKASKGRKRTCEKDLLLFCWRALCFC